MRSRLCGVVGVSPTEASPWGPSGGLPTTWVGVGGLHWCGQWDGIGLALWSKGTAALPEREGLNLQDIGNLPRATLKCLAVATRVLGPKTCFSFAIRGRWVLVLQL